MSMLSSFRSGGMRVRATQWRLAGRKPQMEVLEDRFLPAVVQPLDIVLVNRDVPQADLVAAARQQDVIALAYDGDTASTASLVQTLEGVSAAHHGAPIGQLGLVTHGHEGHVSIGKN